MAFYVKGNQQVAEYLGLKNNTGEDVVFLVSGSVVYPYHSSMITAMIGNNLKEYKLHPAHGLIPADSKLFLENHVPSDNCSDKIKTKQKNENMNENKNKTLKVGDLTKIKNPNEYELAEDVADCVGKKFLIVAMFNYGDTDFVVVEHPTQHYGFVTVPLELCYPIPTHKEKTLDKMKEVCSYKGSWECTFKQFASDLYDAGLRFKDDVE